MSSKAKLYQFAEEARRRLEQAKLLNKAERKFIDDQLLLRNHYVIDTDKICRS